jgi:hypothetical protein
MSGKNRFEGLLNVAGVNAPKPSVAPAAAPAPPAAVPEPTYTRLARPKAAAGKRSDPKYKQISAFVPKLLYKDIQVLLLQRDKDFSDLLEELLAAWYAREGSPSPGNPL